MNGQVKVKYIKQHLSNTVGSEVRMDRPVAELLVTRGMARILPGRPAGSKSRKGKGKRETNVG